jgi:hypothetical protein
MSGTLILILFGVGVALMLFLAGGWLLREFRSILLPLFAGTLIAVAIGWFFITLFSGVLSAQGFAYTFGYGPAGNLTWPSGVRATTFLLLGELAVTAGWFTDHRTGRGPQTQRAVHGWLWAHVSTPARVAWHGLVAPLMLIRDRIYNRDLSWPVRPEHRFELATLLGELGGDVARGLAAVISPRRWAAWIASTRVNRSVPVTIEVTAPFTVDGEVTNVETVQTWHAPSGLPSQRHSEETVGA